MLGIKQYLQEDKSASQLDYYITTTKAGIKLNVFESEYYANALVVQQLVGTLIYYSNLGRYEPRLAKSFIQKSPKHWEFSIRPGAKCEDGEAITAASFAKSLKRSFTLLSKRNLPILENLLGYKNFVEGNRKDLAGLTTREDRLIFKFSKNIRSGLLQVLSFSSLGYMCSQNFNSKSQWDNPNRMISSGPYRIKENKLKTQIKLLKNENWINPYADNAPDSINININTKYKKPKVTDPSKSAVIFDGQNPSKESSSYIRKYQLVPEYITTVLLGRIKGGFFKDQGFRKLFQEEIRLAKSNHRSPISNFIYSETFYPYQNKDSPSLTQVNREEIIRKYIVENKDLLPIIIQGKEPKRPTTRSFHTWMILKEVLNKWSIPYQFKGGHNFAESNTDNFDIRIRTAAVGSGIEVWGLNIVFCSHLGVQFPDPTGRVCALITEFDKGEISLEKLKNRFFKIIQEDTALLPIGHSGKEIFVSSKIDLDSISPTLNVIKFDQLEIK